MKKTFYADSILGRLVLGSEVMIVIGAIVYLLKPSQFIIFLPMLLICAYVPFYIFRVTINTEKQTATGLLNSVSLQNAEVSEQDGPSGKRYVIKDKNSSAQILIPSALFKPETIAEIKSIIQRRAI